MKRRVLLATRSADKFREIRELLDGQVDLVTLADVGVQPSPEEDAIEAFETFRGNAVAKARYFGALTRLPTISDDSGIAVDALDGAPGVHSKRFAARSGVGKSELDGGNRSAAEVDAVNRSEAMVDEAVSRSAAMVDAVERSAAEVDAVNNALLLERLHGVPAAQRGAHYACAAVLLHPGGRTLGSVGTCSGTILEAPRGMGGFGYDPLFVPTGFDRSFGEMSDREKHRLSHRGRAFRALAVLLRAARDD